MCHSACGLGTAAIVAPVVSSAQIAKECAIVMLTKASAKRASLEAAAVCVTRAGVARAVKAARPASISQEEAAALACNARGTPLRLDSHATVMAAVIHLPEYAIAMGFTPNHRTAC